MKKNVPDSPAIDEIFSKFYKKYSSSLFELGSLYASQYSDIEDNEIEDVVVDTFLDLYSLYKLGTGSDELPKELYKYFEKNFRALVKDSNKDKRPRTLHSLAKETAKSTKQRDIKRIPDRLNPEEVDKKITEAVKTLSMKDKKIFFLYYYEELKFSEIAQVLQLKESEVKDGLEAIKGYIVSYVAHSLAQQKQTIT